MLFLDLACSALLLVKHLMGRKHTDYLARFWCTILIIDFQQLNFVQFGKKLQKSFRQNLKLRNPFALLTGNFLIDRSCFFWHRRTMTLSSAEIKNSIKVRTTMSPMVCCRRTYQTFSPCLSDIRDMSPFNRCYDATEVETISL